MSDETQAPNEVDIAEVVETQESKWFAFSIFLLCCLIMLADGFDNQSLNWAAAKIADEWDVDRGFLGPVLSASTIGWMTGAILFSMLSDKIGRRNSILLAVTLFGGFTFLIPMATNLFELAALRFCATMGVGGAMPMAIAMIADYTRAKSRGLRISLIYLGYTAGSSAGGFFVAAPMIEAYGWQSIFYLGGAVALGIVVILFLFLPESVRYLAVSGGSQERIRRYAQMLKPSANYGADAVFVISEQKTEKKKLPLSSLFSDGRSTMTTLLWAAFGFSFLTHFFLSQWLVALLSDHMPYDDAVQTQSLFQLGPAFSFVLGYLLDRIGIPAITWTMFLGVIPVILMGIFVDAGPGILMPLAAIGGILVLGGNIGLNALSGIIYPTFMRTTGTGAGFTVGRIGAIIGPNLAGYLVFLQVPTLWIFITGALPMIPAGIACWYLGRVVVMPKDVKISQLARRH
jgi:AAHS family 4-hydroxybenzoate transporter-like MFS transporter